MYDLLSVANTLDMINDEYAYIYLSAEPSVNTLRPWEIKTNVLNTSLAAVFQRFHQVIPSLEHFKFISVI